MNSKYLFGGEILFKNAQQSLGNQDVCGLPLFTAAAFPLIPLWLLALSGGFPLLSCLLCAVIEKNSLKMCSNFLPI